MTTTLNREQRLLHRTAAGLARDHRAVPAQIAEQRARAASWEPVDELGLAVMRWPEAAGGVGAAVVDVVLVAETLAAGPAVLPFAGPVLAAELLLRAGVSAEDLEGLAELGLLTVVVGAQSLGLADGPGLAWDAGGAQAALALTSEALIVFALGDDVPSADVTRVARATDASDVLRSLAPLTDDALMRWQSFALVVLSADLVGVMAGALDLAVAYAKEREQFGRPIGSFQALAHLMADAHVQLEAARSAVRHAAGCIDDRSATEALLAARVAKAYTSRVALGVTEAALQVHGGIGTTWDSLCHVYLRRALSSAALFGDEDHQLREIAAVRLRED